MNDISVTDDSDKNEILKDKEKASALNTMSPSSSLVRPPFVAENSVMEDGSNQTPYKWLIKPFLT